MTENQQSCSSTLPHSEQSEKGNRCSQLRLLKENSWSVWMGGRNHRNNIPTFVQMQNSKQGLRTGNVECGFQTGVGCNSCRLRCPFRVSFAVMCFAEERVPSKAEVPRKPSQEKVTTVSGNYNIYSLFCVCTFFLPLFSCLFSLLF